MCQDRNARFSSDVFKNVHAETLTDMLVEYPAEFLLHGSPRKAVKESGQLFVRRLCSKKEVRELGSHISFRECYSICNVG